MPVGSVRRSSTAPEATRSKSVRLAYSSRRAAVLRMSPTKTICRRRSPSSPAVTVPPWRPPRKAGQRPEVAPVPGPVARDGLADQEEAAHAVGPAQARLHRPGDDDLVARVLVDLAVGLEHRLGQLVHDAAEQIEVAGAPEALRELGRAREVHEQEDALLRLGPVVDAGDEVAQDVRADHAVHLEDELDGDRDHREEGHRVDQVGLPEAQEEAAGSRLVTTWPAARPTKNRTSTIALLSARSARKVSRRNQGRARPSRTNSR